MYLSHVENFSAYKYLSKYFDVAFLLKFALLMTGIYSFNFGYMSLIDDRGLLYSGFLDQHLNYFAWLRATILYTANLMVHGFGLNSYISDIFTLKAPNGHGVYVGLPCLGYGMISFWLAFIIAQDKSWQQRLGWCIGGVLMLWLLNCSRVALLVISVQYRWNVNKWMDNHTAFNTAVYILTFVMIAGYYQITKNTPDNKKTAAGIIRS
ncbi:MAG: exosortase/archaeosortase family protein [Chitinophagaceae bacterium]